MSIVSALLRNLGLPPLTRRPEDRVPTPSGYRGSLQHEAARCTGCGTCVYVCSPAAISLRQSGEQAGAWRYDAGRCAFCGRCAAFCPTQALTFAPDSLPATGHRARHQVSHALEPHTCPRCGRPVTPLAAPTLMRWYGEAVPADIAARQGLCETCRQRLAGENVKRGYLGQRRLDER